MTVNDFFADSQAQSAPGMVDGTLQALKETENLAGLLRRHADVVVLHRE